MTNQIKVNAEVVGEYVGTCVITPPPSAIRTMSEGSTSFPRHRLERAIYTTSLPWHYFSAPNNIMARNGLLRGMTIYIEQNTSSDDELSFIGIYSSEVGIHSFYRFFVYRVLKIIKDGKIAITIRQRFFSYQESKHTR